MTAWTILQFLAFQRSAILKIAATRWSLLVGALLVLSGSLARNYDGAYFPVEWHALTHGIGVSTVNAFILFTLVYLAGTHWSRDEAHAEGQTFAPRVPFVPALLSFLGLFWMAAPMAWLYGIPYERFLSEEHAFRANAWTLMLVSIWRITLTTRILSVIFCVPAKRVFWFVMLFSDITLLLALWFAPLPVLDFMGGMQQSPLERKLSSAAFMAGFYGVITLLVWLIGVGWAMSNFTVRWGPVPSTASRPPWAAIALGIIAITAWTSAATITQPEQRNRLAAERLLRANRIDEALAELSLHPRTDYPPIWDPPPRPAWSINTPDIAAIRVALAKGEYAPWVEELFWAKCWRDMNSYKHLAWRDLDNINSRFSEQTCAAIVLHAEHDQFRTPEERAALTAAATRCKAIPRSPGQ